MQKTAKELALHPLDTAKARLQMAGGRRAVLADYWDGNYAGSKVRLPHEALPHPSRVASVSEDGGLGATWRVYRTQFSAKSFRREAHSLHLSSRFFSF